MSNEGALWGTLSKSALFGSDGQNSISSGSDVPEGRSGWPPGGEYPEVALSRRSPQDDRFEGKRSPSVKLVDADTAAPDDRQFRFRPLVGLGSPRRQCSGMQGDPVGTSISMFVKP